MRISDWSSDVCSSDLRARDILRPAEARQQHMALNHVDLCFPHHLTGQRREDQARRDCVATDIVTAELNRRVLRQGVHRRLRRRSEEHTSELQSLMRISYAVFCLQKKKQTHKNYIVH